MKVKNYLVFCDIFSHPLDGYTLVNLFPLCIAFFLANDGAMTFLVRNLYTSACETSVSLSTFETSVIFFRSLHIDFQYFSGHITAYLL